MTVDVTGLMEGFSMPVAFSVVLEMPPEFYFSDTNVSANISTEIKGKLTNAGGHYSLKGQLNAELITSCDKCLKPLKVPLELEISEKFSNADSNSGREEPYNGDIYEEDIWEFTGKVIDIKPAIMSCLLLGLPLRNLCSESCKGLCHVCGNDLNLGECGCEKHNIDPRFEGLLSLFQDKEV